jgi:hypothetical protein
MTTDTDVGSSLDSETKSNLEINGLLKKMQSISSNSARGALAETLFIGIIRLAINGILGGN